MTHKAQFITTFSIAYFNDQMNKKSKIPFFATFILWLMVSSVFANCPKDKIAIDQKCVDIQKVHYVKPGAKNILQSTIDRAKSGDYIVLKSGDHYVSSTEINTGLAIKNKTFLTLVGEVNTWLKTTQGWVVILAITSSENITLQNLNLIHEVERGYCFGSVINLSNVKNIKILNSTMDGSGTQAIEMENAQNIAIIGGKAIKNTEGVFDIKNSKNILIKQMLIAENDNSGYFAKGILDIANSENIYFLNNVIQNNHNRYFNQMSQTKNLMLENNQFSNNTFDWRELGTENKE